MLEMYWSISMCIGTFRKTCTIAIGEMGVIDGG